MDLTALQTLLKRYGFSDTDPLTDWLNAALHEVGNTTDSWSFLQKLVSINTTTGVVPNADLPTDFHKPTLVYAATSKRLLFPRNYHRYFRDIYDPDAADGYPQYYFLHKDTSGLDTLTVHPSPLVTESLTVTYVKTLTDLAVGTDVPEIPTDMHYCLVYGAASIALEAENEEDRATVARNHFLTEVEKALSKYDTSSLDDAEQVENTAGYGGSF